MFGASVRFPSLQIAMPLFRTVWVTAHWADVVASKFAMVFGHFNMPQVAVSRVGEFLQIISGNRDDVFRTCRLSLLRRASCC